ncbi:adenosylmethionine--8-amino-7-oxononanoate transaminase [Cyanobacterium aponinum UTEX 3222]|uniref:adenosylmethionine--8-amino-7-oxononanoate transaminase n=1 Tax=Cyanobacterium aponinum TaxID=379064 RepID=UPI00308EF279|nr:adenosylmethionine--8-amino-7-oxononanoate transaminase [Cyanobacterium aponinum UTEX 3222]
MSDNLSNHFSQKLLDFDRNHIWHPYTSLINPLPTYPIVCAEGVRLIMDNGKQLIDGMSSWWTAIHGYNVPELNQVANEQLQKMSHVMFGGITHKPAILLCQKLVEITPKGLEKVFLADSGSVSVEVALKMAIQFQHSLGQPQKNKFMTIRRGYHGDTTGAMSVCDPEGGMHHLFRDFLPKHFFIEKPQKRFGETYEEEELFFLEEFFRLHSHQCAGFILEPIVQGAGGMWFYSSQFLKKIKSLCEVHNMLLIADEIATGFGRTGKLFACEHAGISPDILCLGKALTGGYMTLAATICTQRVAETICQGEAGVFMHGPTFMANPLACAIASKSIELLLKSDWQSNILTIEKELKQGLNEAKTLENVKDVRVLGAIGVIELHQPVNVAHAQKFFVEKGVWIRPFRNLIYIMPPYIISQKDLRLLTSTMVDYCQKINTLVN